jgi:hypothetical protein
MKFIDDGFDGGAPEHCVTGISSVERISPGMIRVSYFARRNNESIVVFHMVWDAVEWRKNCDMISRACDDILAEPPPRSGANDDPSQRAH